MPELPQRLQMLVDMLIPGQSTADIGADHALLALYLVEKGMVPGVIIGELGDGPYQHARKAAVQSAVGRFKIEVRQGDGLQVLHNGEVSNVILAGMGGDTITDILQYDKQKSCSYQHYVFQPMSKAEALRQLLADWGWPILEERLIREKGHYYTAFSSRPGNSPYPLDILQKYLGLDTLQADNATIKDYLRYKLHRYQHVKQSLYRAGDQPQLQQKIQLYDQLQQRLEAMIDDM
ncbi:MAG TPA: SAM-dependent methyltransferase [Syntrophomonadaceae bacterium]|nr:SAM-dependent methyltransferase [Syntrophomonadaceae bacterium]